MPYRSATFLKLILCSANCLTVSVQSVVGVANSRVRSGVVVMEKVTSSRHLLTVAAAASSYTGLLQQKQEPE